MYYSSAGSCLFERSPSLTFIITPALPSKVVELQRSPSGPTTHGPTIAPPHPLPAHTSHEPFNAPDMAIPSSHLPNTALDGPFNDFRGGPALNPAESFDFPFHSDDFSFHSGASGCDLWDGVDAPFCEASPFDASLAEAMNISNNPNAPTHHLPNTAVDGPFNDFSGGPALNPTESFDFPFHFDDFSFDSGASGRDLWDGVDAPFCKASPSDVSLTEAMDISNNSNAPTHIVDQVSELEMNSDIFVYFQHSNQLSSPILCAVSDSVSGMESMGAGSDFSAMEMSTASTPTSTSSSHQISNIHLEGVSLSAPTSPINMEAPVHLLYGVEDMGSVHGGNQAASTLKFNTEFYKVLDKSAWRKQGQGGIKTKKQPIRRKHLSDSLGSTFHEDINTVYDGIRVGFTLKTQNLNLDDGFTWYKYGQKDITEHKHPRNYLRCHESARTGCRILKRIQRCSHDEDYVEVIYFGRHNHSP